jgi:hypothetical protein
MSTLDPIFGWRRRHAGSLGPGWKGVFAAWEDEQEFEKAHIGPSGEISWGEEIEMCPDALYLRITGKRPEDLFPRLRELVQQHA